MDAGNNLSGAAGAPSLQVAFNATALAGAPLAGIGQHVQQLANRLATAPGLAMSFFDGHGLDTRIHTADNAATSRSRRLARDLVPGAYAIQRRMRQRAFNGALRNSRCALYHEPTFAGLTFDGPTVITVHDLSWLRFPQAHPRARVRDLERNFEPALRRANAVITVSEFVKAEVIRQFGIASERVTAIHNGLDPAFRPITAARTRAILDRMALLHGAFFLSIGTLEPRKNIETTLRAYASLPAPMRQRLPLVIAGMKGWRTSSLEQMLGPLVATGQVHVLGYVEREQLAVLTASALALVYPSLYEGFGLPPLEAMGCGVPAIVSRAGSLPEVVGDAGLTVEALDDAALAAAMTVVAEDEGLRASLSRRALERARLFSWAECAARTAAVYRAVSQ